MIEIVGEVPVTANDVIDAYNLIRNVCMEHYDYCVGCPLLAAKSAYGLRCAITDFNPEMWEELKHVVE